MSKGSSKAPKAPDPAATAAAQGAANKEAIQESAKYNQISQQTPYGRVYYTGELGSPNRTQVTELSPSEQRKFDMQNQGEEYLLNLGLGRAQTLGADLGDLNRDFSADAKHLEDATYQAGLNRLQPQFDQQQRSLETSLANKGIPLNSEAYNGAMKEYNQSKNDALSNLALSSVGAGRQEQSRLFNQDLQRRGTLINELSALTQGQGAIQTPNAMAPAQYNMSPVDMAGLINQNYANQMNNYNNKVANQQSNMGGLFGLAGSVASMFCSKTFKADHQMVDPGIILDGVDKLTVAKWIYTIPNQPEGPHIGPYAEDFKEIFGVGDGKTIAIVDMFGIMLASIKALSTKVKELEAR